MTKLELYDCTLREGEQAAGASFSLQDRTKLFSLLDDFGFDYVELGWPIASQEIAASFNLCKNIRKNAKIVAFGSTSFNSDLEQDKNLDSILRSGADYACIFGKTHLEHVVKQLKLTPEENLGRIYESVVFLKKRIPVFYDAEHFFDGFKENQKYALETLVSAAMGGAEKLILCDTNGGLLPSEAEKIVAMTKKYLLDHEIDVPLGVHFHDDCGFALANAFSALPYIGQVQGTINGIGERVGNLNFSEFIPVYMKKIKKILDVKLETLKSVNEQSYRLAGIDIPESRPFVGDSAFAHKGGVHIDATNKGASYEHENPTDFGNERVLLLNSLGGTAGVVMVAERFGYELDKHNVKTMENVQKLFIDVRDLEQKGYRMGALEAEQYLLVEKYFGDLKDFFKISRHRFETEKYEDRKVVSYFQGDYLVNGKLIKDSVTLTGGPIDAAYKSMLKVLSADYPAIKNLKLKDFHVGIARSNAEESTVRTVITFQDGHIFKTVGVDSNILESGLEALTKGFYYYLNKISK